MNFNDAKKSIIEKLRDSKLSALTPTFERLSLTDQYTGAQWPTGDDNKEVFICSTGGAEPSKWAADILLAYACGSLALWPDYTPRPRPETNGALPFILVLLPVIEPVCVIRKVAYDSETIKGVLL